MELKIKNSKFNNQPIFIFNYLTKEDIRIFFDSLEELVLRLKQEENKKLYKSFQEFLQKIRNRIRKNKGRRGIFYSFSLNKEELNEYINSMLLINMIILNSELESKLEGIKLKEELLRVYQILRS